MADSQSTLDDQSQGSNETQITKDQSCPSNRKVIAHYVMIFVYIVIISGYMITIELVCQHEPHRCTCKHDIRTQVDREEVTSELLKHNPALLKYFGKRINSAQSENTKNQKTQINLLKRAEEGKLNQPYQSIVDEKGLKFVLNNNQSNLHPQPQKYEEQTHRQINSNTTRNLQQQKIIIQAPEAKEKSAEINREQVKKQSSKQKEVKKYHNKLKNQSRYLSDTAFRKYFNRQCFQNYGRNNTSNKVDGFVYGNYMKTFNINPHTGENMPINQQTFYHALVSGSPQKYELYNQEVKLGLTQSKIPTSQKQMKSLEKQKLNVQKMLEDNQKHSRLQQKYQHIRLKSSKQKSPHLRNLPTPKSPKNTYKIIQQSQFQKRGGSEKINLPSQLEINTRKHFEDDPKAKKIIGFSPKNQKLTSGNFQGTINQLKPNITSIVVQAPPNQRFISQDPLKRLSNAELANKQRQRKVTYKESYQTPPLQCTHNLGQSSIQCACCVNKMKQFIIELSQQDPDLANRILSSAKKTTLYKNFALNNYQNAAMNPKNYRSIDGKLNVFEKQ